MRGRPPEVNVGRLERLWRHGLTARAIARELGCCPAQVFYWRNKLGLPRHRNTAASEPDRVIRPVSVFTATCPACGARMGPAGHPDCNPEHVAPIVRRVVARDFTRKGAA